MQNPPTSDMQPPPPDTRNPKSETLNPLSKIRDLSPPPLLALFQKRIEGDDALLRLAQVRFREAGLGAEFYAESVAELEWLMGFRPTPHGPVVVHLSRELDILSEAGRNAIYDFAEMFRGRLLGLVIHDQPELATQHDQVVAALFKVGAELEKICDGPMLFLEYAAGLDPALFVETLYTIRELERVSGCLDVGHLGLRWVRHAFASLHPGIDAYRLTPDAPDLPLVIDDLQTAVESALDFVLKVLHDAGSLRKPLHFHLHDGHPLSTASPFGVSDHLSFLEELPIPFEWGGRYALPLMFGPSGLDALVSAALHLPGPKPATFSLEIHPTEGGVPLGHASTMFLHWLDKTNAERMNYWLSVLAHNHQLLRTFCNQHSSREEPGTREMSQLLQYAQPL